MEQRPIWKSILVGMITSVITALLLSIIASSLLNRGVIPQSAIKTIGTVILFLAALAGSAIAAQVQKSKLLITCTLTAVSWLILVLLVKAAFFGGWSGMNYGTLVIVPVVGIAASFIPTGRKTRHIRR